MDIKQQVAEVESLAETLLDRIATIRDGLGGEPVDAPPDLSDYKTFSDRLKHLRGWRRMTQQQLAERCGLSVNAVTKLENGGVAPRMTTLDKLAKGLGVPINAIDPYGGSWEEKP